MKIFFTYDSLFATPKRFDNRLGLKFVADDQCCSGTNPFILLNPEKNENIKNKKYDRLFDTPIWFVERKLVGM